MMVYTALTAADGGPQAEYWSRLVDDGTLTEVEQDRIAGALLREHVVQVDALLPAGCRWQPFPGAIAHPVGAASDEDLVAGIMRMAAEMVLARYVAIAEAALAAVPTGRTRP